MSDRTPCILGIDSGLTMTKAVVFDAKGQVLAVARRRITPTIPRQRHVERDMGGLWRATADAISSALAQSGRAHDVVAVAATAHGDGVYLLDRAAQPLGPGILSLDSRAGDLAAQWQADGTGARALALSGQVPHASAPSALFAWMRDHEPQRFAQIGHVLACKDWLRLCLTGTIGTDLTEASTSFTHVQTQRYDTEILQLYGLGPLAHALPPVALPHQIVGQVTPDAAAATGLVAGTPVVAGLHDVTASALGIGGYRAGRVAIVAGTYSINETLSDAPKTDAEWLCRNGLSFGVWNNMSISPASATNYDWFLDNLTGADRSRSEASQSSIHAMLEPEVRAALDRPSTVLFHPYIYGSPHGPQASGGFFGLHGWHDRGDMIRAVIEGIAFNHRHHVDALRRGFAIRDARLTGGISRSPLYAQIFADALGLPVTVAAVDEAAAWGAALCAGAGVGLWDSPIDDPSTPATQTYAPNPLRRDVLDARYQLHRDLATTLAPLWPRIEQGA